MFTTSLHIRRSRSHSKDESKGESSIRRPGERRAVKTFSKELEGGKEGRVFRKCFYKVHLGMI